MFSRQNLSKKQEWFHQLKNVKVKCQNFKIVTYFHFNAVINAFVLSDVLSGVFIFIFFQKFPSYGE